MGDFILNNTFSESDLGILDFINKIKNKDSIKFLTSGTTGKPKEITHSYESYTKNIKIREDLKNIIWGLTYDYKKIAGSQVILQSYLNGGKIVNLYGKNKDEILELIEKYHVTHISATPTFYRLILQNKPIFNVIQVTLGGEPTDSNLIKKIKEMFPNSSITNIYASTEFGALFSSKNEYFEISNKNNDWIKIFDNHIFVFRDNEWIDTCDVVEIVDKNKFKIIGRENNMINVGGVKINPIHVENIINSLEYVSNCRVFGKSNSITGMVVFADVVLKNEITTNEIKSDLINKLNKYEMPLKINIVQEIERNTTGKIIRR
jgi:acyl-coenzyme A synthetase/AMP-(fatty) acid ligase